MDSFEINKIIAAVLVVFLFVFGISKISNLVYHVENSKDHNSTDIFKTMERKLYFYIMTPAMFLSWFFGLILISIIGFDILSTKWVQFKLLFVILLTFYHFYLGYSLSSLRSGQNTKTSRFFRIINEVPTILLILIVFIVIFKPL